MDAGLAAWAAIASAFFAFAGVVVNAISSSRQKRRDTEAQRQTKELELAAQRPDVAFQHMQDALESIAKQKDALQADLDELQAKHKQLSEDYDHALGENRQYRRDVEELTIENTRMRRALDAGT